MSTLKFVPLTAAVVNLLLGLFVFTAARKGRANRAYLLWGSSIGIWNLGTFFMFEVTTEKDALFWGRVLQFGVIFLPVSLFHLSVLIAGMRARKPLQVLYLVTAFFALSNLGGYFVRDVRYVASLGAYYTIGGAMYWTYIAFYSMLTIATFVLLSQKLRSLPQIHRSRVRFLLVAVALLFVAGSNDILPIIGIYRYPFTNLSILPFGSAAAIFY